MLFHEKIRLEELHNGNVAVGTMLGGMFIGIGVATGLVIGLGLN